jgi:late embryogenesis abundant protein
MNVSAMNARTHRALLELAVVAGVATAGCATLGSLSILVQPPRFASVPDRPAELRLLASRAGLPLGGAGVRLWARVENPNPFGLTLSTLAGSLHLENASSGDWPRAATVELPLGLPLEAREQAEFPIDLTVSLSDLPQLADVAGRALAGSRIPYRLDGTIGVEAGSLGRPTFGPLTLLRGEMRVFDSLAHAH